MPYPDENIGLYLKRLRTMAAVSMQAVAKKSKDHPQNFTRVWLSKAERGDYQQVGAERLRTVAAIYSDLLGRTIQVEWLMSLAGYEVKEPETLTEEDELLQLLKNDHLRGLLTAAAKLIELGHPEDIRFLLMTAHRFIATRAPDLEMDDIYSDPDLSEYVRRFMKELGL